ncbi:MAG: hypothetical protein LBH35_08880 [Treponema sp.]|jgi:hypothetical protein|nr:hypothetical protein [Treponema sp.]
MRAIVQILLFIFAGIFLLWFGYTLFFALPGGVTFPVSRRRRRRKPKNEGVPGAPRTCPVCRAKLENGERVKSVAFPSFNGEERLMHISGCVYCLEGDRRRICPVCGDVLENGEYLVARFYEKKKPLRAHVHVLGCSRCKERRR